MEEIKKAGNRVVEENRRNGCEIMFEIEKERKKLRVGALLDLRQARDP